NKIRQLSKGMRAKVSLSLATAHDPELLILDEPTSGLDPIVRREFLESMIDLAAAGKTVFLSSHQVAEVERVADHVALMRQGKLLLVDSLENLKRNTRQLNLQVTDAGVPAPDLGDRLIRSDRSNRQWRLMVRDLTTEQLAALESNEFIQNVQVIEPGLEEIFVAYIGGTWNGKLASENEGSDSLHPSELVAANGISDTEQELS
ncbi:MAG: ABC transporter ATP-binding protein, partial [Planctomycetota bacterium]